MGFDAAVLKEIFSVTTGVWTIAAVLFVGLFKLVTVAPGVMAQWLAWRIQRVKERDAREDAQMKAKAADWDRRERELERLSARLEKQEAENERLHQVLDAMRSELSAVKAEAVQLRAMLNGLGEVRQAAANASAEARSDERERREKGGP